MSIGGDHPLAAGRLGPVEPARPAMRGWLHLVAAPIAALAGVSMIVTMRQGQPGVVVYAIAGTALFTVSALYHRRRWSGGWAALISRLDHAMIFVIIAASYTPVTLAIVPAPQSQILLIVVWTGAVAGVVFRVLWFSAPRWLYTPLYLLLGWAVIPFLGHFTAAGPVFLALVFASGICYTAGAVVYALKAPDPRPLVFGFHEVFHSLTIAGWGMHFASTWLLVS